MEVSTGQVQRPNILLGEIRFGLNWAPKIMTKILKTVFAALSEIKNGTSSYVDDIFVNVSRVNSSDVICHLLTFGLTAKPPEKIDFYALLGLKLRRRRDGKLWFVRNNEIPSRVTGLTKRN